MITHSNNNKKKSKNVALAHFKKSTLPTNNNNNKKLQPHTSSDNKATLQQYHTNVFLHWLKHKINRHTHSMTMWHTFNDGKGRKWCEIINLFQSKAKNMYGNIEWALDTESPTQRRNLKENEPVHVWIICTVMAKCTCKYGKYALYLN